MALNHAVTLMNISWAMVAGCICTYIGEQVHMSVTARIILNTLIIVLCTTASILCIMFVMSQGTPVPLDSTIYI